MLLAVALRRNAKARVARASPSSLIRAYETTGIGPSKLPPIGRSYHQQYLAKNPPATAAWGGTDVSCPVGFADVKVT